MAWIRDTDEASAPLREIHTRCADPSSGRVDNILRVHALHPEVLAGHLALYEAVRRGTPTLRKVERELIAFVVSQTNGCHY